MSETDLFFVWGGGDTSTNEPNYIQYFTVFISDLCYLSFRLLCWLLRNVTVIAHSRAVDDWALHLASIFLLIFKDLIVRDGSWLSWLLIGWRLV